MLQDHLEQLTRRAGHLESVRNLDAADPDDLAVPDQQRNAVSDFGGDFTINQKILQLFVAKTIASTAVAERETVPSAQCGVLSDRDCRFDLRDVCALAGTDRHLEVFRRSRYVPQ